MNTTTKTRAIAALGFTLLACTACAPRERVMDFTYISSRVDRIEAEGPAMGEVESEAICSGEGEQGLVETAVEDALTRADGDAKYLKDATIYTEGACVVVTGTAHGAGTASTAAPAAPVESTPAVEMGTAGGACYGNGTCNAGLACTDNACAAEAAASE